MNDYITTNIPCTLSVPDTTENFRLMAMESEREVKTFHYCTYRDTHMCHLQNQSVLIPVFICKTTLQIGINPLSSINVLSVFSKAQKHCLSQTNSILFLL